ncbi:MAG: hypothetical protein RBR78_11775 [Flavobacteriaceae bacterium]|nr:hypothetical protein [Flavobacteriaceae bacterium]
MPSRQANTQTKTWQRVCLSNRTTKTTDKQADEEGRVGKGEFHP